MSVEDNIGDGMVLSTTYVDQHLENVECLPHEIQHLLSRMLLLDVETKNHLKKVRNYFNQLMPFKTKWYHSSEEKYREISRIQKHLTSTLIQSHNIGYQKIRLAQKIQDFVDKRIRALEINRKNIELAKRKAAVSASGSSSKSTTRDVSQHRTPGEILGPESTTKRLCRVRFGPSIIRKRTTAMCPASTQTLCASQRPIVEGSPEGAARISSPSSASTTIDNQKVPTLTAVPVSLAIDSQDSLKENYMPIELSESDVAAEEREVVVSTKNNLDKKLFVAPKQKKKEKKHQVKTGERKPRASTSTASAAVRSAAKKRKAREMEPGNSCSLPNKDPGAARYCFCEKATLGKMIGCDNDLCPIEMFHIRCVSLTAKPEGNWFCPRCRGDQPNVMKSKEVFFKELNEYNREKEGNIN